MRKDILGQEEYQTLLRDVIQDYLRDPHIQKIVDDHKKLLRETGDWNTPYPAYYRSVLDTIEERAIRYRLNGFTPHYVLEPREEAVANVVLGKYLDKPEWESRYQSIASLRYHLSH